MISGAAPPSQLMVLCANMSGWFKIYAVANAVTIAVDIHAIMILYVVFILWCLLF